MIVIDVFLLQMIVILYGSAGALFLRVPPLNTAHVQCLLYRRDSAFAGLRPPTH